MANDTKTNSETPWQCSRCGNVIDPEEGCGDCPKSKSVPIRPVHGIEVISDEMETWTRLEDLPDA